jgi:hypothetical protein
MKKTIDLPWIASVIPGAEPYTLEVVWKDGTRSAVDLSGWVAVNPILSPLRDPALFRTARVGEHAAEIAWGEDGGDLAIDADHLQMIAEEQRPFGREEIAAWQAQMNLSNNEAADFLHVSLSTLNAYRSGSSPVPARIAMICRAAARDPVFMHAHFRPRPPAGRPKKLAS